MSSGCMKRFQQIADQSKGHFQKKKKVITSLADACDATHHRYNYDFTGRCAANGDQPLSCASRQKSLETTALEFKITIILKPHLVPPALVFRIPKGYRYPRLRTQVLKYSNSH